MSKTPVELIRTDRSAGGREDGSSVRGAPESLSIAAEFFIRTRKKRKPNVSFFFADSPEARVYFSSKSDR
ncbi:hypothetical protein BEQ56_00985 [Anaerolineaceae bacterium oral taxon 439]|nr:hypothetical protein BEQ56_00985 [Anaerolineaceae bacterium oral taxon 439]